MMNLKDRILKLRQEIRECDGKVESVKRVLELRPELYADTVTRLNEELEKFKAQKIQYTFELNEELESCQHEETYEDSDHHSGAVRTHCLICGKYLHS